MSIGILEPKDFSPSAICRLNKISDVLDLSEWVKRPKIIHNIEVLFIRLNYFIDKNILKYLPNLQIICSPTTGHNHIDLEYLSNNKIKLLSLQGKVDFLRNIRATPEHTLGLIISLFRNYKSAFSHHKKFNRDYLKGTEIFGSKFGLIGMGRIGRILSSYLIAIGGDINYYDPSVNHISLTKVSSLDKLIENCRCIILSCNYTPDNSKLIDKNLLFKMKNKYFVNIARGELVDQRTLLNLIKKNFFAGVALDVIEKETPNNLDKLRKRLNKINAKNVILTPHIGGATIKSMSKTEEYLVTILEKKGSLK